MLRVSNQKSVPFRTVSFVPIRLPTEVFNNLSHLPDPLLDNSKEHYKDFHE